jgi:hypothetical protein
MEKYHQVGTAHTTSDTTRRKRTKGKDGSDLGGKDQNLGTRMPKYV